MKIMAFMVVMALATASFAQDKPDPAMAARIADAQAKLNARASAATQPTTQMSNTDLKALVRVQAAELLALKAENQKLRQEIATLQAATPKPVAGAMQGGKLTAPAMGITETALQKGWKVKKTGGGPSITIDGRHVMTTDYTLANGAFVFVVDGKVDLIRLEPKIGMEEDELLHFNRQHTYDGEQALTSITFETASAIVYHGFFDREWQATVDKGTHKVVAINH